jgi:hypothetical protein
MTDTPQIPWTMAATVAGIEARDHKAVAISVENWTRDFPAACDAMEAESDIFVCSSAADERGVHRCPKAFHLRKRHGTCNICDYCGGQPLGHPS